MEDLLPVGPPYFPLRKEPSAISDLNIEFKSFEVTFKRTENLDKLYNALLSMKPTSVESERAFSAAGLYLTKLRSNLSENSLNSLCFFKSVFQTKNTHISSFVLKKIMSILY